MAKHDELTEVNYRLDSKPGDELVVFREGKFYRIKRYRDRPRFRREVI
ncbi:Uncharacterised protein [Mycobacteroides abscessus subsp. abscessus]|nr:Uncharacterised protein [Mycobacteroides abscessus subsp. abscessus]SHW68809.1 Uncharacterised protein [Mycobacteroides abscessus subsp. abscessus]SHY70601.1 Uncharacterised protein [Mycobacteroides abscessus subsp. abscessus]SHZ44534.1 Uncharacterised protein [Mycobacteroides abscessus subsp. abscessus]SKR90615.1 Uncharacterised protein [Mycobacteroides abscessus subsp. abscessus]